MSALTDLEADVAWFRDQRDQMRRAFEYFGGPVTAGRLQKYVDQVKALENELERMKKEQQK